MPVYDVAIFYYGYNLKDVELDGKNITTTKLVAISSDIYIHPIYLVGDHILLNCRAIEKKGIKNIALLLQPYEEEIKNPNKTSDNVTISEFEEIKNRKELPINLLMIIFVIVIIFLILYTLYKKKYKYINYYNYNKYY